MSSFFQSQGFNPEFYRLGSQVSRVLGVLRDFEVVPLPFLLYLTPRIAGHTAIMSGLRKKGFEIHNWEKSVCINGRYETHSFYELLYDPVYHIRRESQEFTYQPK